jgi:hypothetical protein
VSTNQRNSSDRRRRQHLAAQASETALSCVGGEAWVRYALIFNRIQGTHVSSMPTLVGPPRLCQQASTINQQALVDDKKLMFIRFYWACSAKRMARQERVGHESCAPGSTCDTGHYTRTVLSCHRFLCFHLIQVAPSLIFQLVRRVTKVSVCGSQRLALELALSCHRYTSFTLTMCRA